LRWEFGFSCAFCLCHEADLAAYETEDSGQTQVEHFVPQSHDGSIKNDYKNCFYICRYCNGARRNAPNSDAQGRRLLNPCVRAWGEVFVLVNGELSPASFADRDAVYTWEAYDLDDLRKVRRRTLRKNIIEDRISFLEDTKVDEEELLDLAVRFSNAKLVEQAKKMNRMRRLAIGDLLPRFRVIPRDCNEPCRCGNTLNHSLPEVLEEQILDLSQLLRP
jgi:hypothetical protein